MCGLIGFFWKLCGLQLWLCQEVVWRLCVMWRLGLEPGATRVPKSFFHCSIRCGNKSLISISIFHIEILVWKHWCSIPTLLWAKHLRPCKLHLWVILSTWIISCGGRVTYPKLTSKKTWLGLYQKAKQLDVLTFPVEFDPQESAVSAGSRWHGSLIGSLLLDLLDLFHFRCFKPPSSGLQHAAETHRWRQSHGSRGGSEPYNAGTFSMDSFRGSAGNRSVCFLWNVP